MKMWLPYVTGNSGSEGFVECLARGLAIVGHEAIAGLVGHYWQYCLWGVRYVAEPPDKNIILANRSHAFADHR